MAVLVLTAGRHSPSDGTLRAASEPREAPTGPGAGGDRRPNGWASFVGDVPEPPPPPRTATLRREKKVTILDEAVHRLWCWPTPPLPSPSSTLSHGAALLPRPAPGESGPAARLGRGKAPNHDAFGRRVWSRWRCFAPPLPQGNWYSLTLESDVSRLLRRTRLPQSRPRRGSLNRNTIVSKVQIYLLLSFLFPFPFLFLLLLPCLWTLPSHGAILSQHFLSTHPRNSPPTRIIPEQF